MPLPSPALPTSPLSPTGARTRRAIKGGHALPHAGRQQHGRHGRAARGQQGVAQGCEALGHLRSQGRQAASSQRRVAQESGDRCETHARPLLVDGGQGTHQRVWGKVQSPTTQQPRARDSPACSGRSSPRQWGRGSAGRPCAGRTGGRPPAGSSRPGSRRQLQQEARGEGGGAAGSMSAVGHPPTFLPSLPFLPSSPHFLYPVPRPLAPPPPFPCPQPPPIPSRGRASQSRPTHQLRRAHRGALGDDRQPGGAADHQPRAQALERVQVQLGAQGGLLQAAWAGPGGWGRGVGVVWGGGGEQVQLP